MLAAVRDLEPYQRARLDALGGAHRAGRVRRRRRSPPRSTRSTSAVAAVYLHVDLDALDAERRPREPLRRAGRPGARRAARRARRRVRPLHGRAPPRSPPTTRAWTTTARSPRPRGGSRRRGIAHALDTRARADISTRQGWSNPTRQGGSPMGVTETGARRPTATSSPSSATGRSSTGRSATSTRSRPGSATSRSSPARSSSSTSASRSAVPAYWWSWPMVFAGQLMVALCFCELAARYPGRGLDLQLVQAAEHPARRLARGLDDAHRVDRDGRRGRARLPDHAAADLRASSSSTATAPASTTSPSTR